MVDAELIQEREQLVGPLLTHAPESRGTKDDPATPMPRTTKREALDHTRIVGLPHGNARSPDALPALHELLLHARRESPAVNMELLG
ncbi:MAG: hypothetical protein NVS3B26_23280 [Mycobacteriales bacterium]